MTTSTMTDAILLHRVPGDPVRTRLADTIRETTYAWPQQSMSDLIGYAASQLGMTADAAAKLLGLTIRTSDVRHTPDGPGDIAFTLEVIPDGVRACYRSDCTHGPGYIPASTGREPDVVITGEQAIAEGEAVPMDAWGTAIYAGEPVTTVSRALYGALKAAFARAATAGVTIEDIREEYPDADLGDGKTGLVLPCATLGDLLQRFIQVTRDTADLDAGDMPGFLYATDPLAALEGQPIWLQQPRLGEWTAFLPADY